MKIHEYQARQLLADAGIPVPGGRMVERAEDAAREAREQLASGAGIVVVKAQVHAGGRAVVIARFVPIVRTFAPFVAGVGTMAYGRFLFYNVFGAVLWVGLLLGGGYWLGGLEFVQRHFSKVVLAIIAVSLLPIAWEWWKLRQESRTGATGR